MTDTKTVPENGNKPEQARERIRAHRDFYLLCDPYAGYSTLIHELKAFNADLGYPLNQGAVSKIGQEVTLKRELVPKERTCEYLTYRGKKNLHENETVAGLATELRRTNLGSPPRQFGPTGAGDEQEQPSGEGTKPHLQHNHG
jgi:hypothetical protein